MYILRRESEYSYKVSGPLGYPKKWEKSPEEALFLYFTSSTHSKLKESPYIDLVLEGGDSVTDFIEIDDVSTIAEFKYRYPELCI